MRYNRFGKRDRQNHLPCGLATMSQPLPSHVINLLVGPQLAGSHLGTAAWGLSCLQAYSYFKHSANQGLFHRASVAFLLTLNTLNTLLTVHVPFNILVNKYGHYEAITIFSWSFSTLLMTSEFSNFIIRLLFARCVWLFSGGNTLIPGCIGLLSLYTFGASVAIGILLLLNPDAAALGTSPEPIYYLERRLLIAEISGAFVANTSLTSALVYYLYVAGVTTPFKGTKSLLKVLIRYIICSGLIVTIMSLLQLILHLALPLTGLGSCFFFLGSKLYFNSYLAMLNSRDDMRGRVESSVPHTSFPSEPSPPFKSPGGLSVISNTVVGSTKSPHNNDFPA